MTITLTAALLALALFLAVTVWAILRACKEDDEFLRQLEIKRGRP